MNKRNCMRAVLMLMLSTALLTGCAAKGRTPAETIPPFPVPGYKFALSDGMACLDNANARSFWLWILALERYEAAVKGVRDAK